MWEEHSAMNKQCMTKITPQQLAQQLQAEEPPLLLDCRESNEWEYCRIAGALHIPMHAMPWRYRELDASRPVVVYCHHGIRSQAVVEFLAQRGFTQVANLTGGIHAWSCNVDTNVPRY